MSFPRPIQWYHSHADATWLDDTFEKYKGSYLSSTQTLNFSERLKVCGMAHGVIS